MASVVVLDTSALMLPVERDLRLFEELERLLDAVDPVVPSAVAAELDRLAEAGGREGRAATVGRDLVDRHCRVVDDEGDGADDAVLSIATRTSGAHLVTADVDLIERAHAASVTVIRPRGHHRLVVESA